MKDPKIDKATEAEAEAALIALGGPLLNWEPGGDGNLTEPFTAHTETGFYIVGKIAGLPRLLCILLSRNLTGTSRRYLVYYGSNDTIKGNYNFHFYKSLDHAKAACGRHCVAGKWK